MASNNDFRVLLQAVLDSNSIGQDDINKIQKVISKYHLNLTADLDKASVIAEIKKIVPQLEAELKKMTGVDIQINDSALLKAFNQIEKQAESTAQKLNKIQLSLDDGTYQKQIISLRDGFASLSGNMESAEKQVLKVREAYNKMLNTDGNDKIKAEQEFKQILKQQELQLAENRSEAKKYIDTFKQTKLGNDIQKWLDTNTAATKEARKEMERYLDEVNQGNVTPFREKEIRSAIGTLTTQMRTAGKLGDDLVNTFKKGAKSFIEWTIASGAVMEVVYIFRQAVNELKEIDTLLTEISKANDKLSTSQLARIGDESFDVASKYGRKSTGYLSGVQEASRAGYENAEAIAELSVAIQGAGDVTEDIANSYVIATDKAYKLNGSVKALTEVFDGTNYITNKNAVNMSELAEAMTIVGSTAASFGVEIDETTAAIATMSSVTQQSGSEVARAFRAILLNIRQVSDEEEGIDAEGLTKYEKACNALGVSLKETRNGVLETRDAMDVLKELSEEYVKLDENDLRRTQLLNSVGGKVYHVIQKCITRMYLIAGNPLEPCTTI